MAIAAPARLPIRLTWLERTALRAAERIEALIAERIERRRDPASAASQRHRDGAAVLRSHREAIARASLYGPSHGSGIR